jgi:hypothetical protein
VVTVGAVPLPPPLGAITIDNAFVPLPVELVALTVKLNVFAVSGVPAIVFPERDKPSGNDPVSMLHVIGVSPVAVCVWLYAVPTAPLPDAVVVMVGAVPVVPPVGPPSGSPHPAIVNPITAARAIMPISLIAFFIQNSIK